MNANEIIGKTTLFTRGRFGAGTKFLITKFLITKFLTHKVPNNEIANHKVPK